MNKWLYLPAATPTFFNTKTEYELTWWSEKSFFKYPAVLISAFYALQEDMPSYPEIVFGDSGGFQNITQNANLDPIRVLRWQESVCTHGLILDVPPYDFTGTAQFGGSAAKLFDKSLAQTMTNAQEMMDKREKTSLKMYGVIQGETQEQREKWLKGMQTTSSEYYGWAVSPKPSYDKFKIAAHLMTAYENGIKNIHVLQVSGIATSATIFEFMKYTKDCFITFDSSTPLSQACAKHDYYLNNSMGKDIRINGSKFPTTNLCSCPVCIKVPYEKMAASNGEAGRVIGLHNLLHRIQAINSVNYIFENDEYAYKKLIAPRLGDIPRFIEYGMEHGVKEAVALFQSKVDPGQNENQGSLLRKW